MYAVKNKVAWLDARHVWFIKRLFSESVVKGAGLQEKGYRRVSSGFIFSFCLRPFTSLFLHWENKVPQSRHFKNIGGCSSIHFSLKLALAIIPLARWYSATHLLFYVETSGRFCCLPNAPYPKIWIGIHLPWHPLSIIYTQSEFVGCKWTSQWR